MEKSQKSMIAMLAPTAMILWSLFISLEIADSTKQEQKTEKGIYEAYNQRNNLRYEFSEMSKSALVSHLPEYQKEVVQETLKDSRKRISRTKDFFEFYCFEGNSRKYITPDNCEQAGHELQEILTELQIAEQQRIRVKTILNTQQEITSVRQNLDTLITEIRKSELPNEKKQEAEHSYSSGISYIESRKTDKAQEYMNDLRNILSVNPESP
jgi:hypothetical protein